MTKFIDAGSSGEWGWHATELALRCPQLFAYHYRMGSGGGNRKKSSVGGGDRAPLLRGSLVHQGLAHHYARIQNAQNGRDPDEWAVPTVAIEACAEKLASESGTPDAFKYMESAKNIVGDYAAHYSQEKLTVLNVEEVFTSDIAGYKFTQRFDLVARRQNGKVYIFDHKTTGRIDTKVVERYTLSGQFLGMANFGQRLFGTDFGGVVVNLIGCGAANSYSSRGSTDFSREEANPAPNALRLFPISVQHARERIDQLDASGLDPWQWPKVLSEQVCMTAYGKCDGYDLCRWGER